MKKYPAPALERGLFLLNLINTEGPENLEYLTLKSGLPKASVSRYLETLVMCGYLRRDPKTKQYHSCCQIDRRSKGVELLIEKLSTVIHDLANESTMTVEWYEMKEGLPTITLRAVPTDSAVEVKAKLGFARSLCHEFDAVARLFLADVGVPRPFPNYYKRDWDKMTNISQKEVAEELCQVINQSWLTYDREYNHNGVRRCAVGVTDSQSKLIGVLAMVGHYKPNADEIQDNGIELLQLTAAKLKRLL